MVTMMLEVMDSTSVRTAPKEAHSRRTLSSTRLISAPLWSMYCPMSSTRYRYSLARSAASARAR